MLKIYPFLRNTQLWLILYIFSALFFSAFSFPRCTYAKEVEYGSGQKMTLDEAVLFALSHNPDLKAAKERIAAQVHRLNATVLDRWPSFSTGYTYTWLDDRPYVRFHDIPGANRFPVGENRDIKWYVQFTQPIFTGFALSIRKSMEDLGLDIARFEREREVLELKFQVKQAYLQCLMARHVVEVADEELDSLGSHLKDAEAMYSQGLIAKNDLLRARVAVAMARKKKAEAKRRFEAKKAFLKALMNIPQTDDLLLEDVSVNAPPKTFDLSSLVDRARLNRPVLKAFSMSLKRARENVRLKKSNLLPQIDLVGRYEQEGDDLLATQNDYKNSHNTIVALKASWQFFQWGKTLEEVREARHQESSLEHKFESLKNQVAVEVRDALLAIDVSRQNLATAKEALDLAKENFKVVNLRYREQLATTSDVLDARADLTAALTDYFVAKYGLGIAMAQLERAVGVDELHVEDSLEKGEVDGGRATE